ncbi:MAG: nicotinamide riboside transporter PnuC [Vicingaceae bacterium]
MIELLEWSAVSTALLYVFLAARGKRMCFLFGLLSSAAFVYICAKDHLYFDTVINSYYVIMSVVGWYSWSNEGRNLKVRKLKSRTMVLLVTGGLALFLILGFMADQFSDASLSYADSFTTVFAIIATWMMVERFLQNWLIWIAADAISIYMYFLKDHPAIAGLFAVYTVMAIYGYFEWRKLSRIPQ